MKFIYAFFSLLLLSSWGHGQIRLGGSDLLAPTFAPAIAAYAEARDIEATIDFSGSYVGLAGLKDGTMDFAIVAIPDGMELPGEGFRVEYLGAKVISVVVPTANPLSEITLRQLASIFGEAEAANFTRWSQLGLTGDWATRSITVGSVSTVEHTLAVDLFRHTVLQSRNLRRNLAEADGIETIRRRFQQDNSGIAILHRVPENLTGMKVLSVARTDSDLAHAPSPETVANNSYPLRLPLYLVFSEEGASEFKDLLRFVVSEEAAEAMRESGLVSLPQIERQRLFFEFDRL